MNVAIYTRGSTAEVRANQEQACREMASAHSLNVVAVVHDQTAGGASPEALSRLAAGTDAGAFIVVVVTDLPRLTRQADVVSEGTLSQLRALFASEYRSAMVERMAAGRRAAAARRAAEHSAGPA